MTPSTAKPGPGPNVAVRLLGRTVAGSAYRGAWLGAAIGAVLAFTEPLSDTATGAAIAASFVGGAACAAILHVAIAARASRPGTRRASRRRLSTAVGCVVAGTAVVALAGCSPAKNTFKVLDAPKVTVSSTTDPVAACTNLYPVETLSHFLGYQGSSGVSLDERTTQLVPPPADASGPWSLMCGFVDNDNRRLGYQVCITQAIKDGPSGLVKANGVNVSGISTGVTPVDERHLVPLFGGTTLRVVFA